MVTVIEMSFLITESSGCSIVTNSQICPVAHKSWCEVGIRKTSSKMNLSQDTWPVRLALTSSHSSLDYTIMFCFVL